MSQPEIKPEKITSPIQLMAAWFVMLILLSSVLLTAAAQIESPSWAAGYLVISTTVLIVIVLISVILMLTKFRPNLQEGKEYAEWLKYQNSYGIGAIPHELETRLFSKLQDKLEEIKEKASHSDESELIDYIEERVLCHVLVSDLKGAAKLISEIENIGIDANVDKESEGSTFNSSQAIWVGSKIQADIAIEILEKAISIWPHLKYISLSSDSGEPPEEIHWQIYIGGATVTAREENLKPWTSEEIKNLPTSSIEEFHAAIRAKYG